MDTLLLTKAYRFHEGSLFLSYSLCFKSVHRYKKGSGGWNSMLKRFTPNPALVCSLSPPQLAPLTSPFSVLVAGLFSPFSSSYVFRHMVHSLASTSACPMQTNNPGIDVSWWTAASSLLSW